MKLHTKKEEEEEMKSSGRFCFMARDDEENKRISVTPKRRSAGATFSDRTTTCATTQSMRCTKRFLSATRTRTQRNVSNRKEFDGSNRQRVQKTLWRLWMASTILANQLWILDSPPTTHPITEFFLSLSPFI